MTEKTLPDLLEEYRDKKTEVAFYLEQIKTLEKKIKALASEHVADTGEIGTLLEVDGARIKASRPYTKIVVNTAKLKKDIETSPALKIYLKEQHVKAGIKLIVD